jgi:hypothetical protein
MRRRGLKLMHEKSCCNQLLRIYMIRIEAQNKHFHVRNIKHGRLHHWLLVFLPSPCLLL